MNNTKYLVYISLLISMAIALHIFESILAVPLPYGAKFGLANIIALITMELFTVKEVIIVNGARVLLGSLIRGTIFGSTFWISCGGVFLSTLAIILMKKYSKQSNISTSIIGAVFHNIGQVAVIVFLYNNVYLGIVLPVLIFTSIPTGILIGVATKETVSRLNKVLNIN